MTIREAIESLEFEKHVCQSTAPYKWTESLEISLTALRLIENNDITYVDEMKAYLNDSYIAMNEASQQVDALKMVDKSN